MDESRMQISIHASPEKIFQALTSSDALVAWLAEHADVNIAERRYNFWGNFTPEAPDQAGGQHPILELEANKRLKYSWHVYDADTTVDIQLIPRGETTIVALKHAFEKIGAKEITRFSFDDFWFLSLENLRRYVDGRTSEARVDYRPEAMKGDTHHTIEIDAPASTVFRVLIEPEQLNRWIAHNASVEPVKGGSYDFGWGMGAMKILDIEPDKRLAYTWGEEAADPAKQQVITWTLEESGGKTRLTLVHSGFGAEDTPGEYAGWRNYQNWVRSIAEYGASWESPIVPLPAGWETIYPITIKNRQSELIA